ncbi:MAG: acyl-CoA-binding protein [Cytophagales bacterium]|nr:acyl-CoA-binding protein [Cytophagales bacterium]
MELQTLFEQASAKSKSLPAQPNDILLKIYALYKQGTEGDVNIEKPTNMFDIVGNAKYNAWAELKGTAKELAQQKYVDLINSL